MSSLFLGHLLTSVSAPIFLQNICVHGRNAGIIIHEREVTGHLIPSQYIYQKQSSSLDFGIEFWNFQIILVHVRFGSLPALDFSSLKCAESLPHFVLMIKLNLLKLRSLHNSLPHQEVLFSPLDEIWCREQLKMNLEKKASSKRVRYCKKVNIYGHTVQYILIMVASWKHITSHVWNISEAETTTFVTLFPHVSKWKRTWQYKVCLVKWESGKNFIAGPSENGGLVFSAFQVATCQRYCCYHQWWRWKP